MGDQLCKPSSWLCTQVPDPCLWERVEWVSTWTAGVWTWLFKSDSQLLFFQGPSVPWKTCSGCPAQVMMLFLLFAFFNHNKNCQCWLTETYFNLVTLQKNVIYFDSNKVALHYVHQHSFFLSLWNCSQNRKSMFMNKKKMVVKSEAWQAFNVRNWTDSWNSLLPSPSISKVRFFSVFFK